MDESLLKKKIPQGWRFGTIDTIKVNYFIESNKIWNISLLNEMLPKYIVDKVISIPIHENDIQDKVFWKFSPDEKFTIKTAT